MHPKIGTSYADSMRIGKFVPNVYIQFRPVTTKGIALLLIPPCAKRQDDR